MALAGSKIQIMNGIGTNLFPRTRATDVVDTDGNNFLDANGKISAKFLPSYVDDVVEVKYMQGTSLAVYANATHSGMYFYQTTSTNGGGIGLYYGNGTKWVSTQACTSDEWVQGNTWQEGKIYVNTYDKDGNGVYDTYRWAGTAPVRITQDIASTTAVRAKGTATDLLVPTEAAVASVSSALDLKITNKGVGVTSVTGTQPIQVSGTAASRNVTLHYGTGSTYGVYLDLANTTSLVAKAKLATGASNGYGTVAALSTVSSVPVVSDFSTVFYLSGYVSGSASAMTSTYLVPSIKLLHDVMSTAQDQYKVAVSSVTQTGSTMTFTRLDGTTFQHIVTSAQYAAYTTTATGAGNANSLGGTAAATIKKAFSSVTQTGTSLVFTGIDGTTKVSHVITSVVYAVNAGDASLLGGKAANQLLVSSAAVAGNAGTATNANSLGGTAAGTIKKAFSSVTQTGTSMVFKALDNTLTSHEVTSALYAVSAGNGGVKSLTSKTDGLKLNATTGAIEISGVAMVSANASTAGKMGMVPAPAKGDQVKFLRGDGTWAVPANTTYGAATIASQGLVKLTDTSAALQYGATGTTVLTQEELNRSIKTYLVTSIFATSADAVAGITNSMKVDHPNEYVAADTGEIYQVISTGTNTVSAKLIVGAGDQHLLIKTDNNTVSGGNARLLAFVKAADSAGDAGTLGGKSADELLVSSAVSAGNAAKLGGLTSNQLLVSSAVSAGTANNANSLGGTAAGTIKKAFSSVTQTGTSMVFKALDNTLTSHEVTSAVYAKTAGGVAWGNVTGKPNIVNTVTNGTVGIAVSPTSGDVKVSGVVFKKPSATSNGQMGMVPGPTSNIAIASAYLRADGTWSVPPNSTYTIPTAATVAETSAGTITNKFITPSAYAGVKANGDAVIAGTDTMRWVAPATLQSKLVHSVTYTGLTHVNALASPNDTVKATSKYIPSEYAILNNCLFYSTIA